MRSRIAFAAWMACLAWDPYVGAVNVAGGSEADDEGYIDLFDGESLEGWHKNPEPIGHGTGGHWAVEDGTLVGEQDPPGSGNGGILLSDRKFGNFELVIDLKPDWGVCSGVFVRSNDQGQCFQMMVDYHDAGNVGHIYGEGSGGFTNRPFEIFGEVEGTTLHSLTARPTATAPPDAFSISDDEWLAAWRVGDWNTARIRVEGNPAVITTWINDAKVSVFDGRTYTGESYDQEKVAELLGDEGSVAVQVHGGDGWPKGAKCRWRNIRVKPL